jgi:large conductance mechanosensitive channel
MLREFKEFIARGSVIDLAVGVIIGAAFGKIVTSLVDGLIMPPIGLLLGNVDFANRFYVLSNPQNLPLPTLAEAKAKAVPVLAYGAFINDLVNFAIIAFVIFLLVRFVNRLRRKDVSTKDCPECLSSIPLAAKRCAACCAQLEAA